MSVILDSLCSAAVCEVVMHYRSSLPLSLNTTCGWSVAVIVIIINKLVALVITVRF